MNRVQIKSAWDEAIDVADSVLTQSSAKGHELRIDVRHALQAMRDSALEAKENSPEQKVALYKTKLAFQRHIPEQSLIGEKIKVTDSCEDDFARCLMRAQLTGYLYGEPGESQTVSYPSDWLSAFKQRWFPSWLLKHYPARITTYEINLLTLYPHFKVSLPNQPHVLKFTVNKTESLEHHDR